MLPSGGRSTYKPVLRKKLDSALHASKLAVLHCVIEMVFRMEGLYGDLQ